MFGVLLHCVLLIPLARKEDHGAPLPVLDELGTGRFGKSGYVPDDPSAALIGEGGQDCFYPIFVLEPVLHHFELELADGCEDQIVA